MPCDNTILQLLCLLHQLFFMRQNTYANLGSSLIVWRCIDVTKYQYVNDVG
jgi:hypothetical protein